MEKEKKNLLVFGYGLGAIACFCGIAGGLKHGFHFVSIVFLGLSFIFVSVTCLNYQAFKLGYQWWMKAAHLISKIAMGFILSVIFILIFTPVSLLFKLIGKDHLERQINLSAKTYWRKRQKLPFQKERYQQQF